MPRCVVLNTMVQRAVSAMTPTSCCREEYLIIQWKSLSLFMVTLIPMGINLTELGIRRMGRYGKLVCDTVFSVY